MASLSQGATVSFAGTAFVALSVRVESSVAELADVTSMSSASGHMALAPTGGHTSPGSITIEVLSPTYPVSLVKQQGLLVFSAPGVGVSVNAICTSVSVEAKVGDLVRSVIAFVPTDYYG